MQEDNEARIHMGHGSGGSLTRDLIEDTILRHLDNAHLAGLADGARLPWSDTQNGLAFTTDSFVVNPLFFPGGDIGSLAVHGTLNDLAMCGAQPRYMSLAFIIEEGLAFQDLERILASIARASRKAGIEIVTGDTKVVEKGNGDQLFINTTGIGAPLPKTYLSPLHIAEGDAILCSHSIAAHGIAIMTQREGLIFEHAIESDTRAVHQPVQALIDAFGDRIRVLRDPTRGGVATVLNELAGQSGLGMNLYEDRIPIDEPVRTACELLGLEPLYVANEGVFMALVDPSIQEDAVQLLQEFPECRQAAIIGEADASKNRKVVYHSAIGGRRVMGMLAGAQLPRIC